MEDNSVFKMTRALTKGGKTRIPAILDPISWDSIADPTAKLETFANNFEKQFANNLSINTAKTAGITRSIQIYRTIAPNFNNTQLTNIDEVKNILTNLNPRKAAGLDSIKNAVLKNLPEKSVISLVNIANAMLSSGYFPQAWKKAKIILIKKPNLNNSHISSYRPISLLSSLGKATERLILYRINNFLSVNNVQPAEQFGFRAEHCTIRQTTRLTSEILKGFNERSHTGAIFFDISKAFDRVWHDGLVIKMIRLGMND